MSEGGALEGEGTSVRKVNPLVGELWAEAWCYWIHGGLRRAWRRHQAQHGGWDYTCRLCGGTGPWS
jgi:hypothetical protein